MSVQLTWFPNFLAENNPYRVDMPLKSVPHLIKGLLADMPCLLIIKTAQTNVSILTLKMS